MVAERSTALPLRKLLITDLDVDWCEHVGEVVEPEGFDPVIAPSLDEVIDLVGSGRVSAAILGPVEEPDPLTVLRMIRTVNSGLPIVLVARHMTRRVLEDALSLAAFSVIQSPVEDELLAEVVHRILTRFFERFEQR